MFAMNPISREERLGGTLSALAGTLTSDFDVVQLLHTVMGECAALVGAQAGGLLLKNAHGSLELVASTSEAASFVEVMQLNADDGPCVESAKTGEHVFIADVERGSDGWVQFRQAALQAGFRSAQAVPLRVGSEPIGAMGMYSTDVAEFSRADAAIAQALADLASVGIFQERALRDRGMLAEQLQRAIDSRVVIEQAKGVIAASADVDMERAFELLRDYADRSGSKLHAVARNVVERSLDVAAMAASSTRPEETEAS